MKNTLKRVLISFSKDANLEVVEKQLNMIDNTSEEYEYFCLFLPRHIVESKGLDTNIIDLLERTLGDRLEWVLSGYETFEEAISALTKERQNIIPLMDLMFVLDSNIAFGVTSEINIFTNKKLIIM